MSLAAVPACAVIAPETPFEAAAVKAVIEAAFGPGHLARTAERLREGREPVAGFTARLDGRVIGSVRLWPVAVGETRAFFLGPIAVEKADRNGGVGGDLVRACLDWTRASGAPGVLLVGDAAYFQRFGFERAPDAAMPGPVDPARGDHPATATAPAPEGPVRAA